MNPDPAMRPVARVLHKPLQWMGVDRRLCIAAWLALVLVMNVRGLLTGVGAFLVVYGCAWWVELRGERAALNLWLAPTCPKWLDAGKRGGLRVEARR